MRSAPVACCSGSRCEASDARFIPGKRLCARLSALHPPARHVRARALPVHEVASVAEAATAVAAAPLQFEARADPAALGSMAAVLALTGTCGAYWWLVVVPSERAAVGRSKRRGEIGQYLEEIDGAAGRGAERWFYTDWLDQKRERDARVRAFRERQEAGAGDGGAGGAGGAAAPGGRARDGYTTPDAPSDSLLEPTFETPMPSFFNKDNPIVFVGGVLLVLSVAASLAR